MVIGYDRFPQDTWYVGEFHEGFAVIHIGKSYADLTVAVGYVDTTGNIAIPTRFTYARDFSEGLAYVESKEYRGYIDRHGKLIIRIDSLARAFGVDPEKISGRDFHEGLAAIGTGTWSTSPYARDDATFGGKWGYINRAGKLVIPPAYRFADNFSEGLAGVVVDKLYGFIDTNGKLVVAPRFLPTAGGPPHYLGITGTSRFHEGRALVHEELYASYGYIDRTGRYAISPRFVWANDFSEGNSWVEERDPTTGQITERGWINRAGSWIMRIKNRGVWSSKKFSEGLAAIWRGSDSKCGYIDHDGVEVIRPAFYNCSEFVGGIAKVSQNSMLTYIDRTGRIIWQ
jgi:hypothetical protein